MANKSLLIVGLGNPEKKYEKTRHNIGFRMLDKIIEDYKLKIANNEKKFKALTAEWITDDKKIILAKPLAFMNNSGESVRMLTAFYKIPATNVLVIHDDIDLPFGTIRLSKDSRSAGHNGVQSIINELGTQDFSRIRIGIGKDKQEVKDFVLQKFSTEEEERLEEIFIDALDLLPYND